VPGRCAVAGSPGTVGGPAAGWPSSTVDSSPPRWAQPRADRGRRARGRSVRWRLAAGQRWWVEHRRPSRTATKSFQTTALTTIRDCKTAVCRSCKQLDTWSPASLRTGPAGAPCPATDPHLDHQAVQLGQRRDLAPPAPRVPPLVTDQRNIVARTSAWFEISRSTPYRVRRSSGHINLMSHNKRNAARS
jgi:hypothetical protein